MAIYIFAFRSGKPAFGHSSTRERTKQEELNISNQPIIFNITYTPWKIKSNATAEERAKFERERPYYEMSDSGNNIYKYMTSDRKLNGENCKQCWAFTHCTLCARHADDHGKLSGDFKNSFCNRVRYGMERRLMTYIMMKECQRGEIGS